MNRNLLVMLTIFIMLFSSCITNYDLEYVRSNDSYIKIENNSYKYRLSVGDLISVQISTTTEQQHDFFNQERSSNSQLMTQNPYLYGYVIKEDGYLDLPSLGKVQAEGFTLRELENIIKQIALSFFEQPVVKLNIINFELTILGEVNKPGTYKIVDPEVNILYALSLAGDMTPFGDRKKVKIIRNTNSKNEVFYVNLTEIDVLNNKDFMLHPHDIVYVAPVKKKFYAINNISNAVSLFLSSITIYLLITQ